MPNRSFSWWSGWLLLAGWLLAVPAWGQPVEKPAKKQIDEKRGVARPPATLTPDERALLKASGEGNLAEVTALLAKGVRASIRTANGDTPLVRAAARGHNKIADLLLSRGANIDDSDDRGTALWWAANRGDATIVKALLANDADVNKQVKTSPAAIAAMKGHSDVVKLLVAKGAKPDVFSCALIGDAKTLTALLKEEPALAKTVNSSPGGGPTDSLSPLHLATEAGHTDAVELLLANGADMWLRRSNDSKASIELCSTLPMLKLYLANKDLLKTEAKAGLLTLFQTTDRQALAKYMLQEGDLPQNAPKFLAELDLEKDRELIDLLVKNGATKHDPGPYGGPTALDFAIYSETYTGAAGFLGIPGGELIVKRNRPMALWLIEQGIPLNLLSGKEGESCSLNHAIRHNELEILKAMIDKGVNLTPQWRVVQVAGGRTIKQPTSVDPPLIAGVGSQMDVIKLLVERGVNVNDADPQTGWTPLHAAAFSNRRELVDYLLANGANPKAKTMDHFTEKGEKKPGETPAQVAANNKHAELAAFLKSKE